MFWPYILGGSLALGWMLSPDTLVRLGAGIAANSTVFLAALAMAILVMARAIFLFLHPDLRSDGRCSQTGLLVQGIGRLPAMSLLLASRVSMVLIIPTGLLVSAGFAFNEIFLYWFPNFGFAFLLLAIITLLHLAGERFAVTVQPFLAAVCLLCLLLLCLAGLAGPASGRPVSVDNTIIATPEVLLGALLLFLGIDYVTPGKQRDSRLPALAALFSCLLLFVFWSMLSLQYVGQERLAASTVPHMLVAREVWGQPGRILMGCIVICGSCGAVNSMFHLACRSLSGLAERGLLPGHPPGKLRRRRFVMLFAVLIGTLMAGGLAGDDILETYIQATLLLWLLTLAMLCFSAGRILVGRQVMYAWHGIVLAALLLAAIIFLTLADDKATVIIRFSLLTLAATTGLSLLWLWKRPVYEVINPQQET